MTNENNPKPLTIVVEDFAGNHQLKETQEVVYSVVGGGLMLAVEVIKK